LKKLALYFFTLLCSVTNAQDKVYLMDGTCKIVKVLEIAPDNITVVPLSESGAPFVNANETIFKSEVILIEYKSGFVEVYNIPRRTAIYNANGSIRNDVKKDGKEGQVFSFNFASLNTLALCNADISAFFERLSQSKKIGLGAMAAYNFNHYVTTPNSLIGILYNAKKNYDLGVFANLYPAHFKRRTTFYFGILFKYTSFDFSKVVEERSGNSVNIKYVPASGSQMATIVDVGTHTNIGRNFFFKTIAGIGGFKLKGDYKQQFNYFINKDNEPLDPVANYTILPKIYLGINFGFSF